MPPSTTSVGQSLSLHPQCTLAARSVLFCSVSVSVPIRIDEYLPYRDISLVLVFLERDLVSFIS